jgi:hypothetical protein
MNEISAEKQSVKIAAELDRQIHCMERMKDMFSERHALLTTEDACLYKHLSEKKRILLELIKKHNRSIFVIRTKVSAIQESGEVVPGEIRNRIDKLSRIAEQIIGLIA